MLDAQCARFARQDDGSRILWPRPQFNSLFIGVLKHGNVGTY